MTLPTIGVTIIADSEARECFSAFREEELLPFAPSSFVHAVGAVATVFGVSEFHGRMPRYLRGVREGTLERTHLYTLFKKRSRRLTLTVEETGDVVKFNCDSVGEAIVRLDYGLCLITFNFPCLPANVQFALSVNDSGKYQQLSKGDDCQDYELAVFAESIEPLVRLIKREDLIPPACLALAMRYLEATTEREKEEIEHDWKGKLDQLAQRRKVRIH